VRLDEALEMLTLRAWFRKEEPVEFVKLSSPEDINSQLMEWLSRAYRIQA